MPAHDPARLHRPSSGSMRDPVGPIEAFWRWSCRDIIDTPASPCRSRRPDSNGDRAFPESRYGRQHA
jgi:hypothetical protein